CFLVCHVLQWVPEITRHCPKVPFLLVGTQTDLRDEKPTISTTRSNKPAYISAAVGEKYAKDVKAVKYLECSALSQRGLKNVMDEAILAALDPPSPKPTKKCTLL
ncbi:hypothetical protein AHF37_00764, partial [Paragonimus kellicotti]